MSKSPQSVWYDFLKDCGPAFAECRLETFQQHGTDSDRRKQEQAIGAIRGFIDAMPANMADAKGVVMVGSCGTGKDHLMVAMARQAIRVGCQSARWLSAVDLFGDLKDVLRSDMPVIECLMPWLAPQLLVISDLLPMNQPLTPFEGESLFRLIDNRSRRCKPTWVNLNVKTAVEASEKVGEKIMSRLCEDALVLNLQWGDYRRKAK